MTTLADLEIELIGGPFDGAEVEATSRSFRWGRKPMATLEAEISERLHLYVARHPLRRCQREVTLHHAGVIENCEDFLGALANEERRMR